MERVTIVLFNEALKNLGLNFNDNKFSCYALFQILNLNTAFRLPMPFDKSLPETHFQVLHALSLMRR